MKVFIGVGHGGKDTGAVGQGLKEKDINLDVALVLKSELEKYGIKVKLSRETDLGKSLTETIKQANLINADIALDLHTNAGGGNGFEAYVPIFKYAFESQRLAKMIEEEMQKQGQKSRGIKTRKNSSGYEYFGFLRSINCPRAILECAFIDSSDISKINTPQKRMLIAKAYARGIIRYFGNII